MMRPLRRIRHRVGHGVADVRLVNAADVPGDEPDLARTNLFEGNGERLEASELGHFVIALRGHEADFVPLLQNAVDHANHDHRAAVAVVPAVENQRAQRRIRIALGRRRLLDDLLDEIGHTDAALPAARNRFGAIEADDRFDLLFGSVDVARRQIDLVQKRDDLEPLIQGQIHVGQRLCFDALGRIDDEHRRFTC